VLLVRRKVRSGDPWSGHMAFPGGYNSTHDASLVVTAMRETLEETGIDLVTTGRLAGELSDVAPRSPLLPPVVVRPFVFIVDRQGETTPSDEIDEAPWFTIADLFDAANQQPFSLDFPGGSRTFDSIQLRGYTIWGLTERILHQFRGIVGL
jgi:8-oxo-dGTP pyrophosphatase MutT (NUDIX family)